jgi:hypothetical protein
MRGDPLGQGFRKVDMAGGDEGANPLCYGFVIDSVLQPVAACAYVRRERHIDAHRLGLALLMAVHADSRQKLEIAN